MEKETKRLTMKRDEIGSLTTFLILAAVLLVGVYDALWSLSDLLSLVPYFIMAGMIGVLLWGFRERIEQAFRVHPTQQPTEMNAKKLELLSPIHMMIMAIGRFSPRQAALGLSGMGYPVRLDNIPNLDKVRSMFSEHADVLGDHHLAKWLEFDAQIKEYRDRGIIWVGKREWQWFDELEQEYQDAMRKANPT